MDRTGDNINNDSIIFNKTIDQYFTNTVLIIRYLSRSIPKFTVIAEQINYAKCVYEKILQYGVEYDYDIFYTNTITDIYDILSRTILLIGNIIKTMANTSTVYLVHIIHIQLSGIRAMIISNMYYTISSNDTNHQ